MLPAPYLHRIYCMLYLSHRKNTHSEWVPCLNIQINRSLLTDKHKYAEAGLKIIIMHCIVGLLVTHRLVWRVPLWTNAVPTAFQLCPGWRNLFYPLESCTDAFKICFLFIKTVCKIQILCLISLKTLQFEIANIWGNK